MIVTGQTAPRFTSASMPPRAPNLNAYAERWVPSLNEEGLSRVILCGEASLRQALTQYVELFHHERHHQGKDNVLLFLRSARTQNMQVQCSVVNGSEGS